MIQADDLKVIPFFQELSQSELEKLAKIMKETSFSKGDFIFDEGDPGDSLYLLAEGEVEVVKTMKGWYKETLSVFKKGRMFGELSFLSGRGHSARARVTQDSRIFILEREDFEKLEKNDPLITQKIMK
ncbi:MAG TPA: cyclic nucleotide-binding domain-containing protein, partial [Nitrospiria bacterium]|nr:cyclic nucleotide-binding domain-containing protein [Nitrospiria bacterium]